MQYTNLLYCLFSFLLSAQPLHFLSATTIQDTHELLALGDSLYLQRDFKQAKEIFEKVLQRETKSLTALRGLSRVATATLDWGKLKKWNRRIVKDLPTDLETNYNLGIAYRETGKFKALMLRSRDFGESEDYFARVLKTDSSYSDVLLQRAVLERWRGNWDKALAWGHRQLRLKPALPQASVELFNLYRLYLIHASKSEKTVLFGDKKK